MRTAIWTTAMVFVISACDERRGGHGDAGTERPAPSETPAGSQKTETSELDPEETREQPSDPKGAAAESDSAQAAGEPPNDGQARAEVPAKPEERIVLIDLIERQFEESTAAETKRLAQKMTRIDKKTYESFVEQTKKRAQECTGLDPVLLETIRKYKATQDLEEQTVLLRQAREATAKQDRKQRECVAASSVRFGEGGILLGGLLSTKNERGEDDLKPTIRTEGWVFTLAPHLVTAWPGRADSARAILDPTEGPYRVRMASTFKEKVKVFEPWSFRKTITVQDYLRLSKRDGHFLLLGDSGEPTGWIDMNLCAFYGKGWEEQKDRTTPFFSRGVATALHGVHYYTDPSCDRLAGCFNEIDMYDFRSMTTGLIKGNDGRPGKAHSDTIRLHRISEATIMGRDVSPDASVRIRMMTNGNEDTSLFAAMRFTKEGRTLTCHGDPCRPTPLGSRTTKRPLRDLYESN